MPGLVLSASLSVLLLAGCAALPASRGAMPARDTLTDFSLAGRFSLRYEEKNYSGNLSWRHVGENNELLLSSPLGQGIAEITTNESGAQLTTSDGKVSTAADSETLTKQVLGYPLPLNLLLDWVRGRSARSESQAQDEFGRPLHLNHEYWRIDYEYDSEDAQALPSRLFAKRGSELDLRLRIDEWSSLSLKEVQP